MRDYAPAVADCSKLAVMADRPSNTIYMVLGTVGLIVLIYVMYRAFLG
jgi:hypothetical protein